MFSVYFMSSPQKTRTRKGSVFLFGSYLVIAEPNTAESSATCKLLSYPTHVLTYCLVEQPDCPACGSAARRPA